MNQPTEAVDQPVIDDSLITGINDSDNQYLLVIPGHIVTGRYLYMRAKDAPPWHLMSLSDTLETVAPPEATGDTPTTALLALILRRLGYEAPGGIRKIEVTE